MVLRIHWKNMVSSFLPFKTCLILPKMFASRDFRDLAQKAFLLESALWHSQLSHLQCQQPIWSVDLSSSCSTPNAALCSCVWEGSKGWPKSLGLWPQRGSLEDAPDSLIQLGPVSVTLAIWGVNQHMKDLSNPGGRNAFSMFNWERDYNQVVSSRIKTNMQGKILWVRLYTDLNFRLLNSWFCSGVV